MSDTQPEQVVPDQPDTDDAAHPAGELVHRPAWLVATRVSALAGYATIAGLAGVISGGGTCGSIGAGPL